MAAKPAFTPAQQVVIKAAAQRVWRKKFSIKVAAAIANLDGQTLEQLVGEFAEPEAARVVALKLVPANGHPGELPNIDVCVKFFEGQKTWKPWTLAAARAGLFGESDLPAATWAEHLDSIEKALEKIRPDSK